MGIDNIDMKNIELKIKINDARKLGRLLRQIGAERKKVLTQIDSYYQSKSGRLKMRIQDKQEYELIHYFRPDTLTHKLSEYRIIYLKQSEGAALHQILADVLGEKVVVKKKRTLWIYGNTRIHLDKVEGLGEYLELESVVKNGMAAARKEYDYLMEVLDLNLYPKEKKSYSDLLLKK